MQDRTLTPFTIKCSDYVDRTVDAQVFKHLAIYLHPFFGEVYTVAHKSGFAIGEFDSAQAAEAFVRASESLFDDMPQPIGMDNPAYAAWVAIVKPQVLLARTLAGGR